jgi:6-phosphogluconolactonase (cycloisomerase 2 family)
MCIFRRGAIAMVIAAGVYLLDGCSSDAWFGSGPGAEAAVTTPSGVQSGLVNVVYTLTADEPADTDIKVTFSENGGAFREATEGPGGEGTHDLSASAAGDVHTFVWDSGADLEGERAASIVIRVQPEDGTADTSGTVSVHNSRFLCAVENRSSGRVRFFSLDSVDGSVRLVTSYDTGGTDPYDIIFDNGFFFITHTTSNDVAVFHLDESDAILTTVEDSPFSVDGAGSKYLATDGSRVFVSNTTGGTISIMNLDAGTGKLSVNPNSGVAAAGCRSLAVRSGRLYVASETLGQILIFDISSDGELLENAASPVTTGGLSSPRSLALAGTRLFAANLSSASICGFNCQGDGSLTPIAGSPFTVSTSGIEQLSRNQSKLFASTGSNDAMVSMSIDSLGSLSEDIGSPSGLTGPSFNVQSGGGVVVTGTTTSRHLEVWTISSAGTLSAASSSPFNAAIEVLRLGISD